MSTEHVERARAGDVEAFDMLVGSQLDALLRIAAAIVLDPDGAQDVVQDSLVKAWRHLPDLRAADAFDAWLRRIVVNTARNAARRRRRVRAIAPQTLAGEAQGLDDRVAIGAALEGLDVDHRTVVALYLDDRPINAIAQLLGIPSGTVKSRLHTARSRLRAALEERDGRA